MTRLLARLWLPVFLCVFAEAAGVFIGFSELSPAFAQEAGVNPGQSTKPSRAQRILDRMNAAGDRSVLIAAHRGGYTDDRKDDAPENSVANVRVAVTNGYEVFETDIQRTADGVFVLVHDSTLERETDGDGTVAEKRLKQLQRLRKRFRDGTLSDHKVATLEEMLDAGKDRILFKPDLKPGIIDHFDDLARLISRHPAAKQVFLRTRLADADAIERSFAAGTPKVEIMFRVKTAAQVRDVHKRFAPMTIQVDTNKGADSLSELQQDAIRTARALGILVETHAYNSSEQTAALLDAGVRMLHTNRPDAVRKIIDAHTTNSPEAAGVKLNGHRFTLPDGFRVELIAGQPLVDRPVSADFDEQGRLYVTDSSGSNEAVEIQQEKRPHRIVRLEDVDGDGKFDTSTVFADKTDVPGRFDVV